MSEKIKVGNAEVDKANYDYFSLLYSKIPKEYVVADLVSKCENYDELYKSYEKTQIELQQKDNIIKEVREYIDNLKPLTIVETSIKEELKSAYNPKKSAIKGTDEYFNAVCHLEDFEIAIWNIKEILDKGE